MIFTDLLKEVNNIEVMWRTLVGNQLRLNTMQFKRNGYLPFKSECTTLDAHSNLEKFQIIGYHIIIII